MSQCSLSRAIDHTFYDTIVSEAPEQCLRALALSSLMPRAGDWLKIVPSPTLGLDLHDSDFQHCLQYWLGT